ncbi:hypothetical protein EST38_g6371 [Candolleomyces aberdarensis]|uniref:Uncharacterized protein n=1 Tax=Candolleomyces aberdarensis TaxID=2316362 RepID=A0A4V1Q3R3_9AGAR|nr:hypothetical protein EST38_g6371 [Candolleomyces aberdarensis]
MASSANHPHRDIDDFIDPVAASGPGLTSGFPTGSGPFGTAPGGFEAAYGGFGAAPGSFGPMLGGIGAVPHGYGTMPSGYGTMPSGDGTVPHGYGAMPSGYGTMPSGDGTVPHGYGAMPSGYGTLPDGSESNPRPYPPNRRHGGSRPGPYHRAQPSHQQRVRAPLAGPGIPGNLYGMPLSPPNLAGADPTSTLPDTFMDGVADDGQSWNLGLYTEFMSSNQTSLDTPWLSSTLSQFLASNRSLVEPETTTINTYPRPEGDDGPNDSSDEILDVFARIPDPKSDLGQLNQSQSEPVLGTPSSQSSSLQEIPSSRAPSPSSGLHQPPFPVPPESPSQPPAAASELPKLPTPGPIPSDHRMAITISDVIGEKAVAAALESFGENVKSSRKALRFSEREPSIIRMAIKILKEWIQGIVISRILSGQLPNEFELMDICRLAVETPEVMMLFSISELQDISQPVAPATWRQELKPEAVIYFETRITAPAQALILRWLQDVLSAVVTYTLSHVLTNPRMFPDYANSWPMDNALQMKTLVLAKTGAYMHLYCKRSESSHVTSFNMLLDSHQHPTAIKAYEMAIDIQRNKSESDFDCHLFQNAALGAIMDFTSHALVYSYCQVVASFLVGDNKIVNHQLELVQQPPGQGYLLVPFCCGILTVALASVEEYGHQASVGRIFQNPGLVTLLHSKVGYTRDFMNFIQRKGTQSEKDDIEWLNKVVKIRVAMAIKPLHQDIAADLGSVVQPSRSYRFAREFANLSSSQDFRQTYVAHKNDQTLSKSLKDRLEQVQRDNAERLELRRKTEIIPTSAWLLGLGTRMFLHANFTPEEGAGTGARGRGPSHAVAYTSFHDQGSAIPPNILPQPFQLQSHTRGGSPMEESEASGIFKVD